MLMTDTATIQGTATALSGRPYPADAVIDAERYWWHLARLRESRTRAEAAGHAWSLATAAGRIAAALADDPPPAPDPSRDPAAWRDLDSYLNSLATALDRRLCPCTEAGDHAARAAWEYLAGTVTRSEFATAWQPVGQRIEAPAAPCGDGAPTPSRAFAAVQIAWAAAAVIAAPW